MMEQPMSGIRRYSTIESNPTFGCSVHTRAFRTPGQNLRQVPELGSDDLRTQIEDAKHSLIRPRMLVAKHEPMHSKVKEDEPMTCLNITFTRPDGIYFPSGPGKIDVSRKKLADKLLSLLSHWPQSIKKQKIPPLDISTRDESRLS
jgi:hypothetical protein